MGRESYEGVEDDVLGREFFCLPTSFLSFFFFSFSCLSSIIPDIRNEAEVVRS